MNEGINVQVKEKSNKVSEIGLLSHMKRVHPQLNPLGSPRSKVGLKVGQTVQ